LEAEIQRLQHETDSFTEDNKQYFALSKAFVSKKKTKPQIIGFFSSAEDSSQQIESLRNELGDYNMVLMHIIR